MKAAVLAIVVVWASAATSTSKAATLVTNLPADSRFLLTNASGARNAQGFWTGNDPVLLTSVTLVLSGLGGGSGFNLRLYGNNMGVPSGTVLGSFELPPLIGETPSTYTFEAVGEVVLPRKSLFWVVAESQDTVHWYESSNAVSGQTFLRTAQRYSSGQWHSTGSNFGIAVDVAAIPEPSTGMMIVLGGLILLPRPRRRVSAPVGRIEMRPR